MKFRVIPQGRTYSFQCWENKHWSELPDHISTIIKKCFGLYGSLKYGYITKSDTIGKIEKIIETYSLVNWYYEHLVSKAKMTRDIYIEQDVSNKIEMIQTILLAILFVKSESISTQYYYLTSYYTIAKKIVASGEINVIDDNMYDRNSEKYWFHKIKMINENDLYVYIKGKLLEVAQEYNFNIVDFPINYMKKML